MGAATTIYVTDADNREILEYNGASGQIQRWYSYGLGPNDVLNQMNIVANTRETMITDIQGSILATLDSGSAVLATTGYRPYGESPSTSGTFQYTGLLRIDPETNGIYYARARMYSPNLGRFLQVDPIDCAGGVNLYAYVGNDRLNLTDPLGLWTLQLGGSIGYTLPFGISDTIFAGIAFDDRGGVAICHGGGLGYGSGFGGSISGGAIVSNAKTVNDLGGPFVNADVGVGTGGHVGANAFYGPSDNGFVKGAGVSAGVGLGGTSYAGPAQTNITPLTSSTPSPVPQSMGPTQPALPSAPPIAPAYYGAGANAGTSGSAAQPSGASISQPNSLK